ncbi:MAG: hypothetical protein ABEJ31_15035, partial [Haloarculaceae archaeon]
PVQPLPGGQGRPVPSGAGQAAPTQPTAGQGRGTAPVGGAGQGGQAQPSGVDRQRLLGTLQELDSYLAAQQQEARSEIQAVGASEPARQLAVSKHDVIVQVRQTLYDVSGMLGAQGP